MLESNLCVSEEQIEETTCNERGAETYKHEAAIDKCVASLRLALESAGISTIEVYRDEHQCVCIEFLGVEPAFQFLNIIGQRFNPRRNSTYSRMRGSQWWCEEVLVGHWNYVVLPVDGGVTEVPRKGGGYVDKKTGPTDFGFLVRIGFPSSDCREVVRKMKRHNLLVSCSRLLPNS